MAVNPLALLGGVGVVALGVVGGLYATGTGTNEGSGQAGNGETKIDWFPLSKDSDYTTKVAKDENYKGKYGETYGKYLTGLEATNTNWWNDKFKNFNKSNHSSDKFSKVESGVGTESEKSLLKVCEAAYKEQASNVVKTGDDSTKFKEENVWKYCSPLGSKPSTIAESSSAVNKLTDSLSEQEKKYTATPGSDANNKIGKLKKDSLISVADPANKLFWDMRQQEVKDGTITAGSNETFFNGAVSIKNKCAEAYEKELASGSASETGKLTESEVKRFCSLEKVS